jgi:peptidoglycan/xylan/chitin deacetylase (PgdA/CDA1 family)
VIPLFLQYHKVTPRFELGGTRVSPRQLRRHCRDLREAGFEPTSNEEFLGILEGREPGRKTVLFTFDDGYQCVFTDALPVLKEFGFVGSVFVPTAFIGKENLWDANFGLRFQHLDARELRELRREGWLVGSHGLSHPDLRRLGDEELRNELEGSKRALEELLDEEVFMLSYPYGSFDDRIRAAVRDAGYRCAFRSGPGDAGDVLALGRRPVYCIDRHVRGKFSTSRIVQGFERGKERVISGVSGLSPLVRTRIPFLARWVGMRD